MMFLFHLTAQTAPMMNSKQEKKAEENILEKIMEICTKFLDLKVKIIS